MSPGVCAAAVVIAVASPKASANEAAERTISVLFLDQRLVYRKVYHCGLPVAVLDQRHGRHRVVVLHLGPNADRVVAWVVALCFLDGLSEFARRPEHPVVLLLRFRQIIAAGDRLGFRCLPRWVLYSHLTVLTAFFDNIHG